MSGAVLSPRASRENWDNWEIVAAWMAHDLQKGRLGLVLGAGASIGFGLPDWPELVHRAYIAAGLPWPDKLFGSDFEGAAKHLLLVHLAGNETKFARLIRKALYATVPEARDLAFFANNHLLLAICALIAASERGQVKNIISYNFDDLVEEYLRIQGLLVRSPVRLPVWAERVDIEVHHPHGLLPVTGEEHSTEIVFVDGQFERLHGETSAIVRERLSHLLLSNIVLFVGVSGRDERLLEDLERVAYFHPARTSKYLFWGIRFSDDENDPLRAAWEKRGIVQITVEPGYDDLPKRLFDICQKAVDIELRSDANERRPFSD